MILTIDNKKIMINKPVSLLELAEKNNIYIPHLCSHPELLSYGGCRLCIVEVDGMRGYPTACTTMARDGMVVRTQSKTLNEMRYDLVQLILSEHPSACLMCEDIGGCTQYQETIRKVGVTTGCRWCPNDKDCDLQRVVEHLDVHELTLPGLYRNLELEKYDPFFDRDYNLCIYCGKCVRICNEHRKSGVLSLKQRGKLTTIGPAFGQTHIDANCEFCGACVSVCPTGAMSEKSRKWWGVPEKYLNSFCPLCSLNCDIQTLSAKDKLVGTLPPGIPHEAGGDLCVKGRFCLSEMVNRTERMREPEFKHPEGVGIVDWSFAIKKSKEILAEVKLNKTALYLSPNLTLEEITGAKIFADKILKTDLITSSVLNDNLIKYMSLAKKSVPVEEIENSDSIVSIFLNGNYNFAPITLAIKNAAINHIPYFQIGWIKDTTSRYALNRIEPGRGKEIELFRKINMSIEKGSLGNSKIKDLIRSLTKSKNPVIIVGPDVMDLDICHDIIDLIKKIVTDTGAKIIMPHQYGNLTGLLSVMKLKSDKSIRRKINAGKIDLLYLIGDIPFDKRPNVKKIIYQNSFPPPCGLEPDLTFPTSTWGEIAGSYIDMFGNMKHSKAAAKAHSYSISNLDIFAKISGGIGKKNLKFGTKDLKKHIPDKYKIQLPAIKFSNGLNGNHKTPNSKYPYLLLQEKSKHTYHGLNLGESIPGLHDLINIQKVEINPADAKQLGIKNGDPVILKAGKTEKYFDAVVKKTISKGVFHITTSPGSLVFDINPCAVSIRRNNV